MRALFGTVGLLLALAIVGTLAVKQLRATGQAVADVAPAGASPASGTVREQSRSLQKQVGADVAGSLQQSADRRADDASK